VSERAERAVVVMAKVPRPGRVKTRIGLPEEAASRVYQELLQAVLTLVDRARERMSFERVLAVALSPEDARADAERLAPRGWRLILQRGEDLGARIQAAAADAGAPRVVVIGSDAPTLPSDRLLDAFAALERTEAVFGPTEDGGYYLVGLRGAQPALFAGIPWSSASVMAETRRAAAGAGIAMEELAPWYDVDRAEDLARAVADGFACRASTFGLVAPPHGKDRP
jgi:rSAM/selenodomain-associated transferase 1